MIKASEWAALQPWQKVEAIDVSGKKYRIAKDTEQQGFIYAPKMKRRGWYRSAETIMADFTLCISDPDAEWHHRIERARKALNKSGLWPDLHAWLDNLSQMEYEDVQAIRKADRELFNFRMKNGNVSAEDHNREVAKYPILHKYPFVIRTDIAGKNQINGEYFDYRAEVKLKSMYFGTNNRSVKDEILEHLMQKETFKTHSRAGYDVSYEYNADKNKAIYAEEYRNCGNGHYYLALDEKIALFYEDD